MANITLTSADALIPEIWAAEGLRALRKKIVLAKAVTRDTDYAQFNEGDKLNIPLPPTFTASTKTAGGAVTLQQPTDSVISLTLNKHKEVSFILEDAVRAVNRAGGFERYMGAVVNPLAVAVEDDLFALYAGFATSIGTSGTDITAALTRTAQKTLNDADISEENRTLILSTKDDTALRGDSTLAAYFAQQRPEAVADGVVAQLSGFDIRWSTRVPVVAGSPNSTKCLAIAPDAMILATRPLPTDGNGAGAQVTTITDPVSGLSLRVTMAYNATYLGMQVTVDILYGVAEGRDASGVVVLT